MINFQARYITSGFLKDSEHNNKCVNFVELELDSNSDKKTLKKTNRNWIKEYRKLCKKQNSETNTDAYLAESIYRNFKRARKTPNSKTFYAITTQNDNFEKLNHEDILGLTEITTHYVGKYEIENLQAKPNCTASIQNKPYHKIGTSIIDCLKKALPYKEIQVSPIFDVSEFYEKNGFEYDIETQQVILKA